ncbi:flavodoxin family protein [Alkaliphilus pronyensis]|uniref:Flavodoxin family protein n=1 Tax=Alkaliphilus pronyensis TaxID=1482732 RepID=A0A6I0F6C8_9FIRM|nr:flavodoxin family protein [Alkaliphilus pronyensis]KAB3532745.1 flavodoxin family protein [Alkaliphilus pronyensis]
MIKVLAIVGSPRKGMNNDILLENFIKGMKDIDTNIEVEKIYAAEVKALPCIACDACTKKLGCILKDSTNEIYEKYNNSDIIIVTSPLYFNSVSAQLKALIDRNQAIWSSKYALNNSMIDRDKKRLGFVICTAGAKEQPYGLSAITPIMDLFFKSINTEYIGNYFVSNLDEKPVSSDEKILIECREHGRSLMEKAELSK